ncbi:MAG: HlyD family efflux transporter periplasmic adaptor subunit [Selenomonas sp.]|uniref:HlyD family secretion protein n=1 Tax=Selenomonas sp. TaxID=2053611 RepID=UPI0025CBC876|nr:HlyD family efflux transporter periplasmic adaptor subunit [Selenomonas sp.]MCR5440068.1 HlyD family efflux transporter periplasmic adaptor subunit [Selenomonas sp.]
MEVDITNKANKFIRFGLIGLVLLALIVSTGVYFYQHHNKTLTIYDAQVTGNIVQAKAKSPGKITEIVVSDGDHVEAGDVIARLESSITDEQIQQLEQNVKLAQQSLEQLKKGTTMTLPTAPQPQVSTAPTYSASAQREVARLRAKLANMRANPDAYSRREMQNVQSELNAAQAAASIPATPSVPTPSPAQVAPTAPQNPDIIKQAEMQVQVAQAALDNAKEAQQATDILAPTAGTVMLIDDIAEGAEVKADQVVVNLLDPENAWVEAKVTPEQAKNIRLGQFAAYELDKHKLQGSVKDIVEPSNDESGEQADADGDSRVTVRISLPSGLSFTLKPGMTTTLKFAIGG